MALLTYGFALTNFTVSIDNEIPILPDYGLDLGRWGQNLIVYHIFKGHLQYFSLVLSLFLFSFCAIRLSNLFKFQGYSALFFCGLFVTFPQISYQVVFGMMADIAALGILFSVFVVELFLKGLAVPTPAKKFPYFLSAALLLVFTLSMYQAFILVPTAIYTILFFQNTFQQSFDLKSEIRKTLVFGGILVSALVLYYISVKIICPVQQGGYLTSFVSEGSTDNRFLNFCSIWSKNLVGGFYYGETLFILATLCGLVLFVYFFIAKKQLVVRFVTLLIILMLPFLMSSIITNGYHPPRLYLTSNLVFAFIIVFVTDHFNLSAKNFVKLAVVMIMFTNFFFVTKLFNAVHKIYSYDRRIAEKIDFTIQTKYPSFSASEKYVYFYGHFPFDSYQKFQLKNSEIFSGSIFVWDNGNNYRITNFFREADVAEYRMLDTKEQLNTVKDSIAKMPVWPNQESVRMFNNIVVVKLGNEKGSPLYFE
ncbi:glucosyltransferase domain-containing protein [Flavobacterium magnum]|nr:glucosyltransferase domain-containing protein [Flavobacterium magnum]